MKSVIILLVTILISFNSFSQQDSVISYFPNGKIESVIKLLNGLREGESRFYWENGNLKEVRSYVNGKVEGLVKIYYPNGNQKEFFTIENGKREGPTSLFSEDGSYLTDLFYEEGKLINPNQRYITQIVSDEENFSDDYFQFDSLALISQDTEETNPEVPPVYDETNLENDSTFFSVVEVFPEPVGGMKTIQRKIIYPKEAKTKKVEGVVKVLAFIDKKGKVVRTSLIEGIGFGCDEEAQTVVRLTKFKPGLQRGTVVNVKMEIPVEFKLN